MKNENRKKSTQRRVFFAYFCSAKRDVFYRRKIAVCFFIIVRENVNSNAAARVASRFKNVRIFNTFIVLNIHSHSKIIVILLSKQQLRREKQKNKSARSMLRAATKASESTYASSEDFFLRNYLI